VAGSARGGSRVPAAAKAPMAYPSARRGARRPALPASRHELPAAAEIDEETTRHMAKRQRGSRPGQRAPLQRGGRSAAPAPGGKTAAPARPSGTLSDDELERAAQLEAQIVAEERTASASLSRGRDRRRTGNGGGTASRPRPVGALAAIADDEYVYVVRDLRKIAVIFALIFGLLLASWLLLTTVGIGAPAA